MNRIHKPIRLACAEALYLIFSDNKYAEKIVEHDLRTKRKWGARDRRTYAEIVYDIVRWWRTLVFLLGGEWENKATKTHLILPKDKVSALAIIDQIIELYLSWADNKSQFQNKIDKAPRAVQLSVNSELDVWGQGTFGAEWFGIMKSLNERAPYFLRGNQAKASRQELIRVLASQLISVEPVATVPTAVQLIERKNVFVSQAFQDGYFEMQDGGSQMIAPLLEVQPGQRVIDACAGAGGKTLHLADLMKNKGQLIALDINEYKLNELKSRAKRAGLSIIETRVIESSKVIKRLHDSADRLLLDVPCSGLGVIRRHPDSKWKFSLEELGRLMAIQEEILSKYPSIVKRGGKFVYATCSLAPQENEKQVQKFLNRYPSEYELEEELHISPTKSAFDGFYAARIRKI